MKCTKHSQTKYGILKLYMIPSKLLDKHFKPLVVTTSMVSLGTFVLGLGELFPGLPNRFFLATKYIIDRPSNYEVHKTFSD
jgi:hypothetical protein